MKTNVPEKKTAKNNKETFFLFFSGALYGAVFFKLFLTYYNETVAYTTYHKLYVLGWLISSLAGTVCIFLMKYFRKKFFPKESCFYLVFAFLNIAFLFYLLLPSQWSKPGLLVYFVILQALGFGITQFTDKFGTLSAKTNILCLLSFALGFAWFTKLYPDWYRIDDWKFYNYLFFAGIVCLFLFGIPRISQTGASDRPYWTLLNLKIQKGILLYCLAFFIIAFSINTLFNYDPYHYSFYLGPVADLAGGKSLLVNINAQYGVLVIYFLRFLFLFLPIGFVSFSIILATLTGVQYLIFYFIVRKLFGSGPLAFFALLALLLINHFAQYNGGILYPSVGPLHFGFIYVLMALIILRNEFPQKRNLLLRFETLVVAIAFFWSMEVCTWVVVSYVSFLLYESSDFKKGLKFNLDLFLKAVFPLVGWILAIAGFLYADVFRRTHEWPHWSYYLDYISSYTGGSNMLQLPGMGYWWLVVAIFYFSLYAIVGIKLSKERFIPPNFNVIVLLTFYGILQFTYYFGRANWNNLLHISMPSILLVIYWLYFIRRYDPALIPGAVKKPGYALAVFLVAFFLQKTPDLAIGKIKMQPTSVSVMLSRIYTNLFIQNHSVDPNVLQVVQLMKKYSGDAKSLVYFLGDSGLNVSMASGIINTYPYSDTDQPRYSPFAMKRILTFDPHLKAGDYIYTMNPIGFEKQLFDNLVARFDMELAETIDGISVYKIIGERKSS